MTVFDVFNPLQQVTLLLTEEQINGLVEWFDENSKPLLIIDEEHPVHVITIEDLMKFLELKKFHRRSFQYPSYYEVMKEAEKLRAGVTRMLTKEQFIYILNNCVREPDLKHELKLAFKIFDTEKRSFLEIDEIKAIVTSYADTFNDKEICEMLRDANVRGDGNVFYEDFVESLFGLAPELYQLKAEYLYLDPDEDPSVLPEPEPIIEEPLPLPTPRPPPPPPKKKGTKKKK